MRIMIDVLFYSLLYLATFLALLWVYSRYVAEKPRIYTKLGSELHTKVHQHLNLLKEEYQPAWWCPNGMVMTIVRETFRACPSLPFERELMEFSDGGVAALDSLAYGNMTDETPIIVFLPGITGTTHECAYILHAAMEASRNGWRSIVVNPRALGGVPVKTSRLYNAACSSDFEHAMGVIDAKFPKAKKIGCGFSMGGMILWHYLASKTADTVKLDAGMVISSPFDSHITAESLERFFPRVIFNSYIAQSLVKVADPHRHLFEHLVDFDRVKESKTLREFDTHFTAPLFGYKDAEEYYDHSSLHAKVAKIPIPTVTLNAVDDVFAPVEALPLSEISKSETVVSLITTHGGHTSYMEGTDPNGRGYVEKLLQQWGNMIFKEKA